jgi:hypothetical protein
MDASAAVLSGLAGKLARALVDGVQMPESRYGPDNHLSTRMANMFLIAQIITFGIGSYCTYSDKKLVRTIGKVLQVLSGLVFVLSLGLLFQYHHHHAHVH